MNIIGCVVVCFSPPIAHLLGQTAEVAALMSSFCKALAPGMFPLSWALVLYQVLQIQGRALAPMLITLATVFINIGAHAGFIKAFCLVGAPLATTASRILLLLMTLAYAKRYSLVPGLTFVGRKQLAAAKSMLVGAAPFFALALSGAVMMGLEAGSFDVTTALQRILVKCK
jgi:Na+-driven multidrug efflux pump